MIPRLSSPSSWRATPHRHAAEAGGHVRKGEHGTKVSFLKQLQVKDAEGE
jgi:antirestriction protein ArdC